MEDGKAGQPPSAPRRSPRGGRTRVPQAAPGGSPWQQRDLLGHVAAYGHDILFRFERHPVRRFSFVSPSSAHITGYRPEEYYADPNLYFARISPQDHTRLRAELASAEAGPRTVTVALRHREGQTVWVEHVLVPVFDAHDDLVAVEGIARDITERRQAEDERAELLELERVERIRLENAIRSRQELLAQVTHDLKSPLTAVVGYAHLVASHLDHGRDPRAIRRAAERILSAAQRMRAQLDELLDAARLQAGEELVLARQRMDLVELARQVAQEHALHARRAIMVETDLSELAGHWDYRRLERVLENVLGNAVKYSPPGSRITLSLAQEGERWAVLTLEDAGIGIPERDLPHIFEPFYRASNVGERAAGTGLGLAGARQIVEQHGGSIRLESRAGVGTRLTIRLPLREAHDVPQPQRACVGRGESQEWRESRHGEVQ